VGGWLESGRLAVIAVFVVAFGFGFALVAFFAGVFFTVVFFVAGFFATGFFFVAI
jgi:hypothetical protein